LTRNRESESRSMVLRCVERIEELILARARNPRTVIRHSHGKCLVALFHLDENPPTFRHRLPRVSHQVEKHLADLSLIDAHPRELGRDVSTQLNPMPLHILAHEFNRRANHTSQVALLLRRWFAAGHRAIVDSWA